MWFSHRCRESSRQHSVRITLWHRSNGSRIRDMRASRKPLDVLLGDMCSRSHARLHLRSQEAEGGMGKSMQDFRSKYNHKEASTPPRVEQHPTEGYVHHELHLKDQGDLWGTRLDKRECRWWWDGANMTRRPHTTVCHDANRRSSKGEISLLLRASIYVVGRRKPHADKEQHVGRPHALHALERRKRKRTSERPQGGRGPTYENYSQFRQQDGSHRGTFGRRGSFHSGPSRQNSTECVYCGKIVHHEEECRKKKHELASTS